MNRPNQDPSEFQPSDWEAAERVIRRAEIRADVRTWSRRLAPLLIVGAVFAGNQIWVDRVDADPEAAERAKATRTEQGVQEAQAASTPAPKDDSGVSGGSDRSSGDEKPLVPAQRERAAAFARSRAASLGVPGGGLSSVSRPAKLSSEHAVAVGDEMGGQKSERPARTDEDGSGVAIEDLFGLELRRPPGFAHPSGTLVDVSVALQPVADRSKWLPRGGVGWDGSWALGAERSFPVRGLPPGWSMRAVAEGEWNRARITVVGIEDVGQFSYATRQREAHSRNALGIGGTLFVERPLGVHGALAVGGWAGWVAGRKVELQAEEPGGVVRTESGWGTLEGVSRWSLGPVVRVHVDGHERYRWGVEVAWRIPGPHRSEAATVSTESPFTVRFIAARRP
jgi:hypothetical protein